MILTFITVLLLITAIRIFLQLPRFGKLPAGDRLARIQRSTNYRDNKFQNIHPTPDLTEGASFFSVAKDFFFDKSKRSRPQAILPSRKTNLLTLPPGDDIVVWFGHSSYFMQVDGKKILVDPVFSGNASPVSFTTRSYKGSDVYTTDDIPMIDYLFITHDHWDHLDYQTITRLKPRIKKIITGLGVGAHLERWGFDAALIEEKDWNEAVTLGDGFIVNTVPARHFSGRGFRRQPSLWMSFVLTTPARRIYLGGDSGYDDHFRAIGEKFGPFDLAILECGQYNQNWKYIHMMPEEVVKAAMDLQTNYLLPVHWSKFSLGQHAWDEPIIRLMEAAKNKNLQVIHPLIGEAVDLDKPAFSKEWWKDIA
jgi:L-ascorbate metabolism protein UlaG (beta-lactamase superfamily)